MKKVMALFLSVLMIFSVCCIGVSAAYETAQLTKYPVIMVPGYSSSEMFRYDEETGEKIHLWGDAFAQVSPELEANLGGIITDLATYLLAGNVEPVAKRIGDGFTRIFGDLKTNADGSSYYDVYNYINTPEECNYANLRELYPDGRHQAENEIMSEVCNKVGAENAFVFTCDFRMGAVQCANKLKSFVDAVLEYTGSEKVNIVAVSHGGQVAGTYLTLYGYEGKVNNAVLTVPALGGAGIAYDAFNVQNVGLSFGDVCLVLFIQHGMMLEEDLQYLVEAGQLGFLDDFADALVPYIMPTMGTWGSLWDFIPVEYYEDIKADLLDPVENAALIAQSDYMHYEIMSPEGEHYFAKGFKKAQDAGTNIYILAGYDIEIVTGMQVSSDAIITTPASTGATCAPYGERFSDGYTQKVDTGFYQVSPSMSVDASTCYLPEHTWLIEDYYHGMTYKDPYTRELMYTLLLNDESYDVHSFERFPQFHATTNPAHSVHAQFNSSTEGYVSSEDNSLVITNVSASNDMVVTAVTVLGLDDIEFTFVPFSLAPGESKSITFKGEIPQVSLKNFELTVSYFIGTYTPIGERTFDFTIMNGEAVEYDEENPLTAADNAQRIDEVLDDHVTDTLEKYGVKGIVSVVFTVVYRVIEFITDLVNAFKSIGK